MTLLLIPLVSNTRSSLQMLAMENEHNHNDQISREMVMSFDNQNHQLCGPDGGFTAAGRDSLLFQVLLFNVQIYKS